MAIASSGASDVYNGRKPLSRCQRENQTTPATTAAAQITMAVSCWAERDDKSFFNWFMGKRKWRAGHAQTCIRMISWYADVTLLRTCKNNSNSKDARCAASATECSSSFPPFKKLLVTCCDWACDCSTFPTMPSRTDWNPPALWFGEFTGATSGRLMGGMEEMGGIMGLSGTDRSTSGSCL